MNQSPIFIVGCPRSGTTLLRNLLRSHPNITFPGDSHFIPNFYRVFGDPSNGREARRLAKKILSLQWTKVWGLSLEPADFGHCRSYAQLVSQLYEAWVNQEGKPRWGDKTGQFVADIPLLVELFPQCQIIHIIRDGRDVALSMLRVNFGPRNAFMTAHTWQYFVNSGIKSGKQLTTAQYLEVQYEALLRYPEANMKKVCRFLNEPFCEAVLTLNPPDLTDSRGPIIGSFENRSRMKKITRTNSEKWCAKMRDRDKVIFESIAGDLLTALGYKRECLTRRISSLEQLYWKAHHLFWWSIVHLNSQNKLKWIGTDLRLRWIAWRSRLKNRASTKMFNSEASHVLV